RRLFVEGLENRRMLATFMVTNTNDSGDGSLRSAIQLSNTTPGLDTIQFDAALSDETINLTSGQIQITQVVKIDGQDRNVTIDASGSDSTPEVADGQGSRVFEITDGAGDESRFFAEFRNVTITGGDVTGDGGAIHSRQVLRMFDVTIRDSHATRNGGGLFVEEALARVENSIISGNTAGNDGGGVAYVSSSSDQANPVRFYRTEFLDNSAGGSGGGLYVRTIASTGEGELHIDESLFSGNSSSSGAGMRVRNGSAIPIRIHSSTFDNNTASSHGGGILISNYHPDSEIREAVITNNTGSSGGGISMSATSEFHVDRRLLIAESEIAGNTATRSGGGIFSIQDAHIFRSTISGNTASELGGGVAIGGVARTGYYSRLTIEESTFEGNTAERGGGFGLDNYAGSFDLLRSTFVANTASEGGGIFSGRRDTFGDSRIVQSTIAGNSADMVGGIYAATTPFSILEISHNTITENVTANNATDAVGGIRFTGEWGPLNHNIIHGNVRSNGGNQPLDASFPAAKPADFNIIGIGPEGLSDTNLVGVDPLLDPLADNGGPTMTYALQAGSPAIDAGDPNFVDELGEDQRGKPFRRVFDGNGDSQITIDIGAIESQPIPNIPPTANAGEDDSIRPGQTTLLDGSDSFDDDAGPNELSFLWQLQSGPGEAEIASPNEPTTEFLATEPGDYVVQLTVSDGDDLAMDTVTITVLANGVPTADATLSDTTGELGTDVLLNGTRSSDPEDDPLTYQWTLIEKPLESSATLDNTTSEVATFTPDANGVYQVELIVHDGFDSSPPANVTIRVNNSTWYNFAEPSDVNNDGATAPLDALLVINELTNREYSDPSTGMLIGTRTDGLPFFDTNDDLVVAPIDALLVINELGSNEAPPSTAMVVLPNPNELSRSTDKRTTANHLLLEAVFANWEEN
ncbi:MAG: choice-of-anchor Q domain-containing protein, partial [Planctomycetota bacterium]